MTPEQRLLNALSGISDDLIAEAAPRPRRVPWRRLLAVAACVALVVGLLPHLGGRGGGSDGTGIEYDHYVGPVMPLTVLGSAEGLTATRQLTYDFAPYAKTTGQTSTPTHYHVHTLVSDDYTLYNTTNRDMTVTAVYPFPARLSDFEDTIPSITVDHIPQEAQLVTGPNLHQGAYSGSELIEALKDEAYMTRAFDVLPMGEQPVTVYQISSVRYDGPVGDNPTLAFRFCAPVDTSHVLTYGAPGMSYDDDTGEYRVTARRLSAFENDDCFVVVLGADLTNPVLQGYSNGACEPGTEVEGFTADLTRYETTLGAFLQKSVAWDEYRNLHNQGTTQTICTRMTDEDMAGYTLQLMEHYDSLGISGFDRMVFLEDWMSAALYASRMMYLTFEVTIPAGGTAEIQTRQIKDGSTNYRSGRNQDRDGYDMMTRLGSNLRFTIQTASIINTEGVTILDQSFGFDLENGITTVTLDMSREHYWINVKRDRK